MAPEPTASRSAYRKNQTQNKYPNPENQTQKSNNQTQKMKLEKKKIKSGLRGLLFVFFFVVVFNLLIFVEVRLFGGSGFGQAKH